MDGKLKISLLWVEDDPNDVLLIKRAFKKIGVEPVHICSNGEEAVRYLQGEPPFDNRVQYPTPTLIVSDLKMPRMGGLELLGMVSRSPHLSSARPGKSRTSKRLISWARAGFSKSLSEWTIS